MGKITRANTLDASYYSAAEGLYPLLLVFIAFILPHSRITEAAVVFAMVDLVQRSIEPVKGIASKIANVQRAWTGFERVGSFLGDMEHFSSTNPVPSGEVVDEMRIEIGHFSYPRR